MTDTPTGNDANARTLIIETVARRYDLPAPLVLAICRTESGLNRYALRCEPAYRWLWDVQRNAPFEFLPGERFDTRQPPKRFTAPAGMSAQTEWIGQQASWGVMQVMGALARQFGFRGHFPEICDAMTGADFGCRHLAELRDKYAKDYGWRGVIAAYNAGSPRRGADGAFINQDYVDLALNNGARGVL